MTWKDIPRAGIIAEPGNASRFETGDWRTVRPVWFPDRCIQCLFCWVYCPDAAIIARDGKVVDFDYKHCKGCGICATECPAKPKKAIEMVPEIYQEKSEGVDR